MPPEFEVVRLHRYERWLANTLCDQLLPANAETRPLPASTPQTDACDPDATFGSTDVSAR
jgi:hypothetical protein